MLLRLTPRRDERAALACDDLASGLDAGLTPVMLGGDADHGDRVLQDLLGKRGVTVEPAEDLMLAAAWQAGRGGAVLRDLARSRAARAEFARQLLSQALYPLVLAALGLVAATTTGIAFGSYRLLLTLLVVYGVIGGLGFVVWRGLARGAPWCLRLPIVGPWARALAELPYLEVLRGLYIAGVSLQQAHPRAVEAYPLPGGRAGLAAADRVLQGGEALTAALGQQPALHLETRQLLATGETIGGLEEALGRALQRRRDAAARHSLALGRLLRTVLFAAIVLVVFYVLATFYGAYFGMMQGLRGGR